MKIWILTSEYPPEFGGGIGMYVESAAKVFSKNGHEVTVFTRDSKKNAIEYTNKNLRVIRFLHMTKDYYSFLGYWTALSYQYADEVLDLIDKEGAPDIIEVQDYNAIGYYLLQKKWLKDSRLKSIPIVLHLHTPTFELDKINQAPRYKFPNYWIGQCEKFCMKAADALLSPSQFLKDQIQYIAPNNKIKVINLPYELEDYSDGYKRNFDSKTFLYIGRSEYRKGVVQMIKGAENLWNQGYDFNLKLIGGDTYFHPRGKKLGEWLKGKYKHRIDEGKLIFKDSVPPKELNPEMLNARAVIVPSLYENFPYTCLTSMWLGSPMLVSAHGGQAEMVEKNGVNGFIFDWNTKNDFETKLVSLLNMTKYELRKISASSEKRIRTLCNTEDNVKQRISFFEEVIQESKKKCKKCFPSMIEIEKKIKPEESVEYQEGLLSIIIPFYNLGDYLKETLENALDVDYKNKEIIIVNDGSTEESSKKILEEIRNYHYENIKIVDIENGGLANARNVGAKNANGEFLAFLDADDLVVNNFYSRCIDILNTYENVSFVYSWLEYFGKTKGVWPTFNTEFPYFLGANMLAAFVVVRKQDFISYGLNDVKMEYGLEDYEGWLSMCANGCLGITIPEVMVKYRVRTESMSRQFNPDMLHYLRDVMSHVNESIYKEFSVEIFNLLDSNGPGYLWNNPSLTYPEVGYAGNQVSASIDDFNSKKYELMRIMNSKWGSRIIKLFFKLKLNKLFK